MAKKQHNVVYLTDGNSGSNNSELDAFVLEAFLVALDGSDHTRPLTVRLCTKGGDHHYMLAAYDAIRLYPSHVTIVGTGCVLSAGAFILQAADHRVLTQECRLMAHYGSGSVDKDFIEVSKRYEDVLYAKITAKNADYPRKKFNKMLRDSEHLSAMEALSLGLCDEVI